MKKEKSIIKIRQSSKQNLFLDHFRKWGIITPSAEAAGIPWQIVYHWRKTSPSFAKKMLAAKIESRKTMAKFVLKSISEKARHGSRQMMIYIRNEFGEEKLNAIRHGKNLTMKDMKS